MRGATVGSIIFVKSRLVSKKVTSPAASLSRGARDSSNIAFISDGTPGNAMTVVSRHLMITEGAVPTGLKMGLAPSGSLAIFTWWGVSSALSIRPSSMKWRYFS